MVRFSATNSQRIGDLATRETCGVDSGGEDLPIQDDGAVLLTGSVPDTVEHIFTLPIPDELKSLRSRSMC